MKVPPAESKTPSSLLKELSDRSGQQTEFIYQEETKAGELSFVCAVMWERQEVGRGVGRSKKLAKQEACLQAIKTLTEEKQHKAILSTLYHGSPAQALQQLAQQRNSTLAFQAPALCRVYWNHLLLSSAESFSPSEAKRLACLAAMDQLAETNDPIQASVEVGESSASEAYLRVKDLDLVLSDVQGRELKAVIEAVKRWKSLLNPLGVSDVCVLGSAATESVRKGKVAVDVGLVAEGEIDLEACSIALLSQYFELEGRKVAFARGESGQSCDFLALLKAGNTQIRCFRLSPYSHLLSYIPWLQIHSPTPTQISILRLLKHWKSLKSLQRDLPGEVLDWAVLVKVTAGMSMGTGLRRVVEWLAGGGLLAGRESELDQWVVQALAGKADEIVEVTREAFVTMVQIARESISTVL